MPATAILRSAANTKKKIRQYEDRLASFQWQNSAQTQYDFEQYTNYLNTRIDGVTDPNEILTYTTTIRSARRSFISNEIQREQIDILEGRGTDQDKINRMVDLYQLAVDNQDYNTAQNLRQQIDTLSIKIANEQVAQAKSAQRFVSTMAKNQVDDVEDFLEMVDNSDKEIQLSDGSTMPSMKMLTQSLLEADSQGTVFAQAEVIADEVYRVVGDLYNSLPDEDIGEFESSTRLQKFLVGAENPYTFTIGGQKLDYEQILQAREAAQANNPIYSIKQNITETTGKDENGNIVTNRSVDFVLEENEIDDLVYVYKGKDDITGEDIYAQEGVRTKKVDSSQSLSNYRWLNLPNGEQVLITKAQYDAIGKIGSTGGASIGALSALGGLAGVGLNTLVKNLTNKDIDKPDWDKLVTVKESLEAKGIIVEGDGNQFTIFVDGRELPATLQRDGTVRFESAPHEFSVGGTGLYEIDPVTGKMRKVAFDEGSMFGTPGEFGPKGTLIGEMPTAGKNFIRQAAGVVKNNMGVLKAQTIGQFDDYNLEGVPVVGGNLQGATQVLASATKRSQLLAAQNAAQEAAAERERVQQALSQQKRQAALQTNTAQSFSLNQMPVSQFDSAGYNVNHLSQRTGVAQPTQTISVGKPAPQKKISTKTANKPGVASGVPTGRITSVGTTNNQVGRIDNLNQLRF